MGRSALLIGNITHARKEWEELGSLLELKVGKHGVTSLHDQTR
jgi:glyoxylate reductase